MNLITSLLYELMLGLCGTGLAQRQKDRETQPASSRSVTPLALPNSGVHVQRVGLHCVRVAI
jgi:hypothetical protein